MRILTSNDVARAAGPDEIVDAVAKALEIAETGDFLMPPRAHLDYKGDILLLMPAFAGGAFATKLVSVFPDNPDKGLPPIYGTVILNDGQTGKPLALLEGAKLTAMRTGAVGGLAVRLLSNPGAKTAAVVGAGVQGLHQAFFAASQRNLFAIRFFDASAERAKQTASLAKEMLKDLGDKPVPSVEAAPNVEAALENADMVICATTSKTPVLPDDPDLLKGKTFISIGSYRPDMQEFPRALFSLPDQFFVDTEHALGETGDLINPLKAGWIHKKDIIPLGRLILGKTALSDNPTRFYKTVGMALFDLTASHLIYQKAVEKNLGLEVEMD